jgi:hypothetical protein
MRDEVIDVPSTTYKLFSDAILGERQVTCVYQGYYRELCPLIIGHTRGKERVLAFQFGGQSSSGLPLGGNWKCLDLSHVKDAELRAGAWREGERHSKQQTCVEDVDLDVNIHVRKLR